MKTMAATERAVVELKKEEAFLVTRLEQVRSLRTQLERFAAPTGKAAQVRKQSALKSGEKLAKQWGKTQKLKKAARKPGKIANPPSTPIAPFVTEVLRDAGQPLSIEQIILGLDHRDVPLTKYPARQVGIVLSHMERKRRVLKSDTGLWMIGDTSVSTPIVEEGQDLPETSIVGTAAAGMSDSE